MSALHQVVYQIVSNPTLLAEIVQNTSVIFERFNLAATEAQTLLVVLQDSETLSSLLSGDYLPHPSPDQPWIP
jgi:hypothetical protein